MSIIIEYLNLNIIKYYYKKNRFIILTILYFFLYIVNEKIIYITMSNLNNIWDKYQKIETNHNHLCDHDNMSHMHIFVGNRFDYL